MSVAKGTKTFKLFLSNFLVLFVLNFSIDIEVALLIEVRVVKSIGDDAREGVKGRADLALHNDEVIVDCLLEYLGFRLGLWLGDEELEHIFKPVERESVASRGRVDVNVVVILLHALFAA